MRSIFYEAKKHLSFRETWVGYILAVGFLIISVKNTVYTIPDVAEQWNNIFQDIYTYGATLSAFLVAIGISRLMCYEHERKTDAILYTATNGRRISFLSKMGFAVLYCAAVVIIIGAVSIVIHASIFGFENAFSDIEYCRYFINKAPSVSNLVYGIVQYLFLFLGVLYFAGFVMLVATLTRRTALTICISGGTYLALLIYYLVGSSFLRGISIDIADTVWRFSFAGFMLQESYSRFPVLNWVGEWSSAWKTVLLVIGIVLAEGVLLWQLWRKKDRK